MKLIGGEDINTNAIADAILDVLTPIHARSYRNKSPQTPISPYVVYILDSSIPSGPSSDFYLTIDVFDDPNESVRAIETLSDAIQDALDNLVIITDAINVHMALEQRQYVSNTDLVTSQMVNLRFVCRTYFK